jgi:hypothetical protein
VAAFLTHGPQVTDCHFTAHTDPVVAFTDHATTAAHGYLHPNVSTFTYRHDNPGPYCHTDHGTDRYAYCYRHSVSHHHAHSHRHPASHRYTHSYGHGHRNALAHPHSLVHRHTYRHSHSYGHDYRYSHGYGYAYRNQLADCYSH